MTEEGHATQTAPNLAKMPIRSKNPALTNPPIRDALLLSAMTDTFCEKVVVGGTVATPERQAQSASLRRPPWMCDEYRGPFTGKPEALQVAVMLPTASDITTRKLAMKGRTSSPRTLSGKRRTQRKLTTGAELITSVWKYPHAAAMMIPTRKPSIVDIFLTKGGPNKSKRTIDAQTENPRPMRRGEPQGAACGADAFGQRPPLSQEDPPAQLVMPELMSERPMQRRMDPVIRGGKSYGAVTTTSSQHPSRI